MQSKKPLNKRHFITSLVLLFTLIGCNTPTPREYNNFLDQTRTDTIEKILDSSVTVMTTNEKVEIQGIGAGVVIGQDKDKFYIVTARHVVLSDDGSEMPFTFVGIMNTFDDATLDSRTTTPAVLEKISTGWEDLALISIKKDPEVKVAIAKIGGKVKVGDRVSTVGCPEAIPSIYSEGVVSFKEARGDFEYIHVTSVARPGSSGGPLFNSKGEVVGVVLRSFSENMGIAISSKDLTKWLDSTKISFSN